MIISKPQNLDPAQYFTKYIQIAIKNDLIPSLNQSLEDVKTLLKSISKEKENFAYQHGKWTIKQVLQHINDTERIMAYRLLRFARKDYAELKGFDQDLYVDNDDSNNVSLEGIANEFISIRLSTIQLIKNLNTETIDNTGTAGGFTFSVRVLGWIISGHATHHVNVIKEKYL